MNKKGSFNIYLSLIIVLVFVVVSFIVYKPFFSKKISNKSPYVPVETKNDIPIPVTRKESLDESDIKESKNEYRSDMYGFKIKYPSFMQVDNSSITTQGMLIDIRFFKLPLATYDPLFSVEVYDVSREPLSVEMIASKYTNPKISEITINNLSAKSIAGLIKLTRNGTSVDTFENTLYVLADDRLYLIRLSAPITGSETTTILHLLEFNKFYNSFELL